MPFDIKTLKPTIIDRYILIEFVKTFFGALFLIVIVNHLIELMERLDFFISRNIKFIDVIYYYLYKTPFFIVELSPIAILFAVVFSLGIMAKNREIVAMITGGISFYRIIAYLYITGLLLSILFVFFNESVVVPSQRKSIDIYNKFKNIIYAKDRRNFSMYGKHNFVYHIKYYNSKEKQLENIHVFRTSPDKEKILYRIDARLAVWDEMKELWIFKNGVIRKLNEFKELEEVESFEEKEIPIPEKPSDFEYTRTDITELTIKEAVQYINRLKSSGFQYQKELVDFHLKFSFPFTCLLMMLIGAPLSIYSTRSVIVISMGLSLMVSFVYWVILNIGVSMGKNGILPAVVAAWMGNCIFLVISFFIHKKIPT
ncbi:MAG: LptF/LptG family permease [Spirochaetes bacterium]|nr:LptF/LptG family permease [Spirochaetota bacterium]